MLIPPESQFLMIKFVNLFELYTIIPTISRSPFISSPSMVKSLNSASSTENLIIQSLTSGFLMIVLVLFSPIIIIDLLN